MLFQIKTINGQKTIVPLTADAGAGAPVGSLLSMYKKSSPSGYLYCDGSTFDATAYPLLYAYLGSNVLPDYREFALVGAEQNTTDVYNASTNPNGTIHDHDVYTEGQAKDDQLQTHQHGLVITQPSGDTTVGIQWGTTPTGVFGGSITIPSTGRHGTVTRGKRKAVYFYIKATSGLSENAQDNVINTLNEQRSYSTEEHLTGKKWIDGKDIWSIVIPCASQIEISAGQWNDITSAFTGLATKLATIDILITTELHRTKDYVDSVIALKDHPQTNSLSIFPSISGNIQTSGWITLEYTKAD